MDVSEFIELADEAVANFREWRRFLKLAIESAEKGEADSLSLHKEASRLHRKSDTSRETLLSASQDLPAIFESAGKDSRRYWRFSSCYAAGRGWQTNDSSRLGKSCDPN